MLRLNAEFDNYKKRTLKERMELLATASSDMMVAMLPVMDDFERAIKAISVSDDKSALDGIHLIYNKLKSILDNKGLEAMNCTGTVFDAELHEAITTMPTADEAKKNTVIEEVEKGYLLKGKVIRHAKVVVGG
ncbi:MAG: nucleotide exchange factor GrpE [Bacteroidetes bacterium]|nr:nucleotide exchange factor GrpE [Bacteroidota bacterium]